MITSKSILPEQKNEIILENDSVRASFLPHDGGRLVSLIEKSSNREFIWTNPRTSPLLRYHGADYDNLSAGGIEEAFPNVFPDSFGGIELPFFGEVWPISWSFEESADGGLVMHALCSAYPVRVSKHWTLLPNGLRCSYTLTNLSGLELPYLFGVHPSLNVMPGDKIHMPSGEYIVGSMFPEGLTEEKVFQWPMLDKRDLRVPASQTACEYLQIYTEKTGGTFSLEAGSGDIRLDVSFDEKYFTALSSWMIYGGWRGLYCVMVEFFTGWPLILSEHASNKNCQCLKPRESAQTDVFYRFENIK